MFNRVIVNVITMGLEIIFIPYLVLPKPPLPYGALPLLFARTGQKSVFVEACLCLSGKPCFNQAPPTRIVVIQHWQCPYTMQVVWHQYPRLYLEGVKRFNFFNDLPEACPALFQAKKRLPLMSYHGEKVNGAFSSPAIIRHCLFLRYRKRVGRWAVPTLRNWFILKAISDKPGGQGCTLTY